MNVVLTSALSFTVDDAEVVSKVKNGKVLMPDVLGRLAC